MSIQAITSNSCLNSQYKSRFLGHLREILDPAKENTVKFAKEKPIVASGVCLTLATFVASTISKSTSKLAPIFGIPAIAFFTYQIFFHPENLVQKDTQEEIKETPRTKKKPYMPFFSPPPSFAA